MSFVKIHGRSQIKDNTIDISKLESNFLSGSNWFINSNNINKATITTIPDPISLEDVANKRYVDLKSTLPLFGLNDILVGNGSGYSTLKLIAGTGININNSNNLLTISSTLSSIVTSVNSKTGNVILNTNDIGLSLVENIALSTWNGTSNINTLGNILYGTWNANPISISKGGTGITNIPNIGQVLIGTGTDYVLNTLTAGTGVTITNGPGTITISSTGGGSSNYIYYDHQYIGGGITGIIDGVNTIFTLDHIPDITSVHVYINGVLQTGPDPSYIVSGANIIFSPNTTLDLGDYLTVSYRVTI